MLRWRIGDWYGNEARAYSRGGLTQHPDRCSDADFQGKFESVGVKPDADRIALSQPNPIHRRSDGGE
jgi:hypothetical protein